MSVIDRLFGSAPADRADPIPTAEASFINGRPLKGRHPQGLEVADGYCGVGGRGAARSISGPRQVGLFR